MILSSNIFPKTILCGKIQNSATKTSNRPTGGTLQLYGQVSALAGQFYDDKKTVKLEASFAPAEAEFGAVAKADQKRPLFL